MCGGTCKQRTPIQFDFNRIKPAEQFTDKDSRSIFLSNLQNGFKIKLLNLIIVLENSEVLTDIESQEPSQFVSSVTYFRTSTENKHGIPTCQLKSQLLRKKYFVRSS